MRHRLAAAAALALLALAAAPAAAQPGGGEVLRGAIQTLARAHGPGVQDYSFSLAYGSVRTPVYVAREEGAWVVHTPEETPLADLAGMAVIWPDISAWDQDPGEVEAIDRATYLRAERLEGRPVHVVAAYVGDEVPAEEVDSAVLYVDAETGHVLRMVAVGANPEADGPLAGGRMTLTVDLLGHQETDGLVIPRRVRLRMRLQAAAMTATQRDEMLAGMEAMRAELQGSDNPQARQMLAALELFGRMITEGELDMPMTVEEVLVNPGPPAWLDGMD
jgi:hypothetical protein